MTQKVSIKDRDGLKAFATELDLEFPSNIPTNKLIEMIQEKIDADNLQFELLGEEFVSKTETPIDSKQEEIEVVDVSPLSAKVASTKIETVSEKQELLPVDGDGKSKLEVDVKSGTAVILNSVNVISKTGTVGTDPTLTIKWAYSNDQDYPTEIDIDSSLPLSFQMMDGVDVLFFLSATATTRTTETVPDPDGEEGDTKEEVKDIVIPVEVNDYFDNVTIEFEYDKEAEVDPPVDPDPDPPVDPEPEIKLVNGINTIMGFQFEYVASKDHAYLQISDNLLKLKKMYFNLTDEILLKEEGPRLVLENKFLDEIKSTISTFDIYDARFNNVITCQQLANKDFYHDVNTIDAIDGF